MCSCSVDQGQNPKEKYKKSPQDQDTKRACKLLETCDWVYLQTRVVAGGIGLGSGWSHWSGDTRRRRMGAQLTQRPSRRGRGWGRGRGGWYPRRRRGRGGWGRGRERGGGKEWRGTSSSIGEVREERPDLIIQLSDITLGRRKSGVPEIQKICNHDNSQNDQGWV